jgi:nucleoside-diphosphate-sugar epimerase
VLNVNASSSLGILMTLSRKIPIFSLIIGEQNKRTFLSINNLFAAIAKIIQSIDFSKPNKIYNLSDSSSISLNHLLRIYSQKRIYVLPSFISKIFFSIPFLNNFLCRLYGNFEVSNELIQKDLGINLHTTEQSLPIISK